MLERVYSLLEIIDTELLHGRPYQSAIVLFICFTFPAPLRTLEVGKSRGKSKWRCRSSAFVQTAVFLIAAAIFLRWSVMGRWGADLHERADQHYMVILSVGVVSLAMRFGLAGVLLTMFVGIWIRCFPDKSVSLVHLAGKLTSDRPGILKLFRPPAFLFSPRLGHILDVSLMLAMTRAFHAKDNLRLVPIIFDARLALSRLARIREPEFVLNLKLEVNVEGGKGSRDKLTDLSSGAPRGGKKYPPRSGSDKDDGAIDRECRWFSSALLNCGWGDEGEDQSRGLSRHLQIFKIWQTHLEVISNPENRFQEKLESFSDEVIKNHLQLVRSISQSDISSESIDVATWYFVLRDTFKNSDCKPDPIVRISAVLLALHLFDQRLLTWCQSILEIYLVVDRVDDDEPSDPLRELAAWIYFLCMEEMVQALNPDVDLADLSYPLDEDTTGQLADYQTRLKTMWNMAKADLPLMHVVSKGDK